MTVKLTMSTRLTFRLSVRNSRYRPPVSSLETQRTVTGGNSFSSRSRTGARPIRCCRLQPYLPPLAADGLIEVLLGVPVAGRLELCTALVCNEDLCSEDRGSSSRAICDGNSRCPGRGNGGVFTRGQSRSRRGLRDYAPYRAL